jgi:hypothetical protein
MICHLLVTEALIWTQVNGSMHELIYPLICFGGTCYSALSMYRSTETEHLAPAYWKVYIRYAINL